MGKKAKIGKARRDKFYQLAKETGYRSRASFKLLQLNRKYEFLQQSRVLVDLCAAPGGWTQVAAQYMPVSSVILAIDLVPMKPIRNVTCLQEDITTEKCRQSIKKELQTWKADVFLNDGAPNVGKNWLHDAFSQVQLTLQALKLATEFLRKGGWFVTKVFRSKDYHALLWVMNQLFKKVHATKPQASRNESAEIFVVCQGYLAPDRLDPKFTDPKHVFKDVTPEPRKSLNLVHPEKEKRKAEGYAEGDYTLHHTVSCLNFIKADNHLEILADINQILIDDEKVANHPKTTNEIRECCKDIKVLGKKELKSVIQWRQKMRDYLKSLQPKPEKTKVQEESESETDEEEKLEQQLMDLKEEKEKLDKRKKKKVMKDKRKLRDKMQLNMVLPGDRIEQSDEQILFNIAEIKSDKGLDAVEDGDRIDEESEEEEQEPKSKFEYVTFDRHKDPEEEDEDADEDEDEEDEDDSDADDESGEESLESADEDPEKDGEGKNRLMVDLESKDVAAKRKAEMWFRKGAFKDLEGEEDEDIEVEKMKDAYQKKGGVVIGETDKKKKMVDVKDDSDSGNISQSETDSSDQSDDEDSDSAGSDYDVTTNLQRHITESRQGAVKNKSKASKDGFEIVPADEPAKKKIKLTPVELAIGEEMIKSSKRKRELIEGSYHRYTSNDDGLPDWFVADEARHCRKQLPVTKAQIEEYKERQKAIDARPIKKLAEAKARKKRKAMKKLEKIRKKAEVISDTVDVTDKEKWQQIKQLYKKAGLLKGKKRELTYVVAKKGTGKRVRRPAGVKGQFRVVDGRMKKDDRREKTRNKQKNKPKGKRKSR